MPTMQDLEAAAKMIGDNNKVQLLAAKDVIDAAVANLDEILTRLPPVVGTPDSNRSFIQKTRDNWAGAGSEAQYLLSQFPVAPEA